MKYLLQYIMCLIIAGFFSAIMIMVGLLFFTTIISIGTGQTINVFCGLEPKSMLLTYGFMTFIFSLALFAKENE